MIYVVYRVRICLQFGAWDSWIGQVLLTSRDSILTCLSMNLFFRYVRVICVYVCAFVFDWRSYIHIRYTLDNQLS